MQFDRLFYYLEFENFTDDLSKATIIVAFYMHHFHIYSIRRGQVMILMKYVPWHAAHKIYFNRHAFQCILKILI